jgi:hypothetical protein
MLIYSRRGRALHRVGALYRGTLNHAPIKGGFGEVDPCD